MRSLIAPVITFLCLLRPVWAQDVIGFPTSDFGKIVLSQKQFGGKLEASIGNYNNEPISKYGRRSLFARLGRSIGRVDIQTDKGVFPCTGFLISDNQLLTNYHCVPGILEDPRVKAARIDAVQVVMGYVRDGIERGVKRYAVSVTPIEADKALDYAILKVKGNPGHEFGRLALTTKQPVDSAPYWIIGHPMGEAQRISREDCQSDAPAVAGGRLRHRCDTLPGNSGSPVIDPVFRAAIALHHAGSSRDSINYAIPIARIAQNSKIIAGLISTGPAQAKAMQPRSNDSDERAGSAFDGVWIGEWCSLKTPRDSERCRQLAFNVRDGSIHGRLGVENQPGFAQFHGAISASGVASLEVRGIHKRGPRRGTSYRGSLSGHAQGRIIHLAGTYVTGRGVALKMSRDRTVFAARQSTAKPSAAPVQQPPSVSRQHPHDGVWRVSVTSSSKCTRKAWRFGIRVSEGKVYGGRRMQPGSVAPDGTFRIVHFGGGGPHLVFQYDGTISGLTGTGRFQVRGRGCRGIVSLERIRGPERVETRAAKSTPRSSTDVKWHIVRSSNNCRFNRNDLTISVRGRVIEGYLHGLVPITGRIADQGEVTFSHPNVREEGPAFRYTGVFSDRKGSGTFSAERGDCRGTFTALRQ